MALEFANYFTGVRISRILLGEKKEKYRQRYTRFEVRIVVMKQSHLESPHSAGYHESLLSENREILSEKHSFRSSKGLNNEASSQTYAFSARNSHGYLLIFNTAGRP